MYTAAGLEGIKGPAAKCIPCACRETLQWDKDVLVSLRSPMARESSVFSPRQI
jgi:hypothetical protein